MSLFFRAKLCRALICSVSCHVAHNDASCYKKNSAAAASRESSHHEWALINTCHVSRTSYCLNHSIFACVCVVFVPKSSAHDATTCTVEFETRPQLHGP